MSLHVLPAGIVSAAYSSFTVGAATFDGGDELQRSAPGVFSADGKEFAIAFWFNLADEDDQTHVIFSSRTSRLC